jgi:hypothetical protein
MIMEIAEKRAFYEETKNYDVVGWGVDLCGQRWCV